MASKNKDGVRKDDKAMRMAHPLRVPAADPGAVNAYAAYFGAFTWSVLVQAFKTDELTSNIVVRMSEDARHQSLVELLRESAHYVGATETGQFYNIALMLRHQMSPQPYFRFDDDLCHLLLDTEIDDDLPMELLKAQYPRFFIEFGSRRDLPVFTMNDVSGLHHLEGAYVEVGTRSQGEGEGLYVVFTGSPLGKENALDDSTHSLFVRFKEGQTLKSALHEAYQESFAKSRKYGVKSASEDSIPYAMECLNYLAKALLYISLPETRREVHADKTAYERSIANLKSTAKKTKAVRRGEGLVDHVLITAPPAMVSDMRKAHEEDRRTVKSHWRRPHFRWQAHGPEMKLRKLKLIPRSRINPGMNLGEGTAPTYRVC